MTKRSIISALIFVATLALIAVGLFYTSAGSMVWRNAEVLTARMSMSEQAFPKIDSATLSPLQKKIVDISQTEYTKKPMSYDDNVLRYSNGVVEPWCANYVSWVLREAGAPLVNPNSGGWRIPGVLTLREYYKDTGRFKDAREYTPMPGDVAIFVNTSSFNTSRQHTSIILTVEGDSAVTIGGNERGRLRVSTQKLIYGEKGLVGYGTLQ